MAVINRIEGDNVPRSARLKSKSGFYHIMFRGNELKDIFMDDEDRNLSIRQIASILGIGRGMVQRVKA